MKTLKSKLLAPLFTIGLAIATAFTTQASMEEAAPIIGYATNLQPCDTPVSCDTEGVEFCTTIINGVEKQAFRKIGPTSCPNVLFKPL